MPGKTAAELLVLAYGTLRKLDWKLEHVVENRLIGYSRKKWGSYYDHIIIDVADQAIAIISQLPQNTYYDITGRNKKNLAKFSAAFQDMLDHLPAESDLRDWQDALYYQQGITRRAVEEEQREQEAVEAIMHTQSVRPWVSYVLIGINVVVFIAMCIRGVSLFSPTTGDLFAWGGDNMLKVQQGEWWRMFTSVFVHAGIIHLAFNMYALLLVGMHLEPMLKWWRFLAAYLVCGLFSSMTSLAFGSVNRVSVGASGAIFGMFGVLLALLSTRLLPNKTRQALLSTFGIYVVYTLVYGGVKEGIDNAAHVGGLICGLVLGYLYYPGFKKNAASYVFTSTILTVVIGAAGLFFFLKGSASLGRVSDDDRYIDILRRFDQLEARALQPYHDSTSTVPQQEQQLKTVTLPNYELASRMIDSSAALKLNKAMIENRERLKTYVGLRLRETTLNIDYLNGGSNEAERKAVQDSLSLMLKKISE